MLCLLAAAALAGSAFAQDNAETLIRKSFKVDSGGKLTIRADRGAIEVKTGSGNSVEVEITREASGKGGEDQLAKHKIDFKHEGKDVLIKAESTQPKVTSFFGRNG